MPFQSQAQRAKFHALEAAGKLAAGTTARWEAHTPKGKKLPKRVGEPADEAEKKAFVATFLLKCAAAGVTDPVAVARAAEALLAATEKRAAFGLDTLAQMAGGATGVAAMLPVVGAASAPILGYGAGAVAAGARNKMDEDDSKTLRLAAMANAYRRRAAEAKTQAEVRQLVASDPSKYVVLS